MELAVLTLFAVLLIGALAAGVPILYALIAGLILFSAYSLKCGFTEFLQGYGDHQERSRLLLAIVCS